MRVLGPLQQHDKRDDEERDRVQRQDLLDQAHQRTRVGPGGRLRRHRQVLARHQRHGGFADRRRRAPPAAGRPGPTRPWRRRSRNGSYRSKGRPSSARTRSPTCRPACAAGPSGVTAVNRQALADRPELGVDADDDLGLLADQVHPAHAVERQQGAKGHGQGAAGGHGGTIID